jgi:hypothetical protein
MMTTGGLYLRNAANSFLWHFLQAILLRHRLEFNKWVKASVQEHESCSLETLMGYSPTQRAFLYALYNFSLFSIG